MDESREEKIRRLKQEYKMAEQALSFRDLLAEKRDELEEKIQELKQKMERDTFKLYSNKKPTEEELRRFNDKLKVDARILASVEETKRELDLKLDEYELFSKEMSLHLRKELIQAILDNDPSKKSGYEKLERELQEKLALQETLAAFGDMLNRMHELLKEVAGERKSVKKMNVLRYLFGKNPNVTIMNSLMGIEKSAQEILSLQDLLLERTVELAGLDALLKKCFESCRHLKELAGSRWGWKKLDNQVIPYQALLGQFSEKLIENLKVLENEVETLRTELHEWIEKNS